MEHERISYTWNANDIDADTLVTFELAEAGEGTDLMLSHAGLDEAAPGAKGRHAAGWTRVLKSFRTTLCGADEAYDWSDMRITCHVDAPLPEVFDIWTTSKGLGRFWADDVACTTHAGSVRPGDETFRHGDRVGLLFVTGTRTEIEINNIEKNKFVAFSLGEDYGWVTVKLSEEKGRTKVLLHRIGLPDAGDAPWEIHADARGWWIFNLMNMKAALLHGQNLRVRDGAVANGLSVDFRPDAEGGGGNAGPHDWTAFDVCLYIDAPPGEVLARWRTARGLESFFVGEARFTAGDGGERAPDDEIASADAYAVAVTADRHGDGALLHLRQTGMSDEPGDRVDGSLNCRSCWIYFVTALKGSVEHGFDLRDRAAETADSVSVGYNR